MHGSGKMFNPQGIMKQSGTWKNGFMKWNRNGRKRERGFLMYNY